MSALPRLGPPVATPGRHRALWARLSALAPTTHALPPRPATAAPQRAAASTESAYAVAARLIETRWLVTLDATGRHQLHHAIPTRAQLTSLLADSLIDTDLTLTCGTGTPLAAVPSALDATAAPRCSDCGDALGYPIGTGAPQHDTRCIQVLCDRLDALR